MARSYSYASSVDIHYHLPLVEARQGGLPTFTGSSIPNITAVDNILQLVSDEIDAALAIQGYEVPVATTATQALQTLRSWTAIGAAMYVAGGVAQGVSEQHLAFLERRYTTILNDIRNNEVKIEGLSLTGTRNIRFGVAPTNAGPFFKRYDSNRDFP